jgi:hypothetical protein
VGLACGGDGDDEPTPAPTATEEGTPPPESEGPISGDVLDLAAEAPLLTVLGENDDDLPTGSHSLALGDFNGDGDTDLLMGAPQADGPDEARTDGGEAYVIFGPFQGEIDLASAEPDVTIYGALPGDGLGYSSLAGDLNDDGTDDILVAAPGVTAGFDPRTDQGRIYVFYGGSGLEDVYDLSQDVFDFTVTGAEGFSRLGHAMDMGDVNGDGTQDLVAGAPYAGREPGSPPGSERTGVGEVYIIFGGDLSGEKNIASLQQDVLLSGKQGAPSFGQFGAAVAVADFNGDGTDDIAIGAHRADAAADRAASGAVYVFTGRGDWPERLTTQADEQDAAILGPSASAGFGFPLTAGDFNGDGTGDIAAGSQTETSEGGASSGAVRVIFGGSGLRGTIDLSTDEADVVLEGRHPGSLLPSSLSARDIDGDNDSELFAGAQFSGDDEGRRSGGLVYILTGGPDFDSIEDLVGAGNRPLLGRDIDDRLGVAIAGGRFSDEAGGIAVLASGASAGEGRENAGAVYLVPVTPQ